VRFWQRWFNRHPAEEVEEKEAVAFLIAGLGNPGRKYDGSRHNIGFMVVDRLADKYGITGSSVRNKAIVADGRIPPGSANRVVLAKPQTYMNSSGDAIGPLARFYQVPPENVLVIYDELDLPFGTLRMREKGGAGGHNGMKSIINHLGQGFPRLRLGIGRPPGRMPPAAYVLQPFGKDELPLLDEILDAAVKAIETYMAEGVQLAMSQHNQHIG
jgi:PTH1 family peptidyl-tRNA hydrolase